MPGRTPCWRRSTTVREVGALGAVSAPWVLRAVADFDNDRRSDLLWYDTVSGRVYVWLMQGTSVTAIVPVGQVADLDWSIIAVGDYDGDGHADLLWQNRVSGAVYLWKMQAGVPTSYPYVETIDGVWSPVPEY